MTTTILLDGKKLRDKKFIDFKNRVDVLKQRGIIPKLVVILVGENIASQIYIKHKQLACLKLGIESEKIALPIDSTPDQLKKIINDLNNDNSVHGILIQFPLPKQFEKTSIVHYIDPNKDVDGLHPLNQGLNLTKESEVAPIPCTPNGVMELLKEYKIDPSGKNAVIIGRSNIVGRPMNYLLTHANATVTTMHTKTKKEDYLYYIKNADIIISAAGIENTITSNMVKPGVVIIDVGIIRTPDNKIRGDINYLDFLNIAKFITPVPGGVGPMTIAMLMHNLILLAEQTLKK